MNIINQNGPHGQQLLDKSNRTTFDPCESGNPRSVASAFAWGASVETTIRGGGYGRTEDQDWVPRPGCLEQKTVLMESVNTNV